MSIDFTRAIDPAATIKQLRPLLGRRATPRQRQVLDAYGGDSCPLVLSAHMGWTITELRELLQRFPDAVRYAS